MSGFTKLFSSIVMSSIWAEDNATRIIWVTMLALANRDGVVEGSVSGLANAARVSREECETALAKFESPDPESKSPAYEGRRIRRVDGGWELLNYAVYRHKLSADERREYLRIKQAEHRAKQRVASKRGDNKLNGEMANERMIRNS